MRLCIAKKISKRYACFLWAFCLELSISFLLVACASPTGQNPAPTASMPTATATPSPTKIPVTPTPQLLRPDLERGIIDPGWSPDSYGVSDTTWSQEIKDIKKQTAATWLEIPVLFDQAAPGSTTVVDGPSTPSVDAFAYGVREAVSEGFHVFFIPLSGVETPDGWAGIIQFSNQSDEQAWFNSYWDVLKPYAVAAQASGATQMAIGTELSWLQDNAPASLWNQLIDRVHSVFTGTLTYDVNWYPTLYEQPASWLKNPELNMIGVSEYVPLTDVDERIDPASMPALWKQKIGSLLDTFASKLGKQIMLTEIGYRNNSDAGYNPSYANSTGSADQQEQAGAFTAALEDVFADTHIAGIFFWAWNNAGALSFAGTQAVNVIYRWYTMMAPAS